MKKIVRIVIEYFVRMFAGFLIAIMFCIYCMSVYAGICDVINNPQWILGFFAITLLTAAIVAPIIFVYFWAKT